MKTSKENEKTIKNQLVEKVSKEGAEEGAGLLHGEIVSMGIYVIYQDVSILQIL